MPDTTAARAATLIAPIVAVSRSLAGLVAGALTSLALASSAFAAWPERPVRVVVPFAPAGPTDIIARILTGPLGEAIGATFFVENKAGAGGNIGIGDIARSEPDGYSLLLTSGAFMLNPSLYDHVPYDPVKDFAPISLMAASPNVVVVTPSLGVKTLAELIALGKTATAKLNYASAGVGTTPHLDAERLKALAGFSMAHVSHNGAGPAVQSILAETVQVAVVSMAPIQAHIQAGKVIPLAVTAPQRWPDLPEVPTLVELGYTGFVDETSQLLLAPARTPQAIIDRLATETNALLRKPEIAEKLRKGGFQIYAEGPDGLARRIASEVPMWHEVVAQTGVKIK